MKRKKTNKRKILYVSGVTLDGPIVVTHVLPQEDNNEKPQQNTTLSNAGKGVTQNIVPGSKINTGKRNCGHSQKSVRVDSAHKKK